MRQKIRLTCNPKVPFHTTAQKLWSALTSNEMMKEYWFGCILKTEWKTGAAWELLYPDGRVTDTGEIVEFDPPKRLVLKWRNECKPELKAEGELSHHALQPDEQYWRPA